MTLEQLKTYKNECIEKHPEKKREINELWQLCLDEIDSGESKENEIYLCESSIDDLINE